MSGDAGSIAATKHLAAPGGTHDSGELAVTWHLTASGSAFSVTLAFCYTDAEVEGLVNEGALQAFRWDGGQWIAQVSVANPDHNCVTVPDVSAFSAWTLFDTSQGSEPTAVAVRGFAATGGQGLSLLAGMLLAGAAAVVTQRRKELGTYYSPARRPAMNEPSMYEVPAIVYEGALEIQAGSPLSLMDPDLIDWEW